MAIVHNKIFIDKYKYFEKIYNIIPKPNNDKKSVIEIILIINANKYYRFKLAEGRFTTIVSNKRNKKSVFSIQKWTGNTGKSLYTCKFNYRIPYKYEKLTKLPKMTLQPIYASLVKIFPTDIASNIAKYYSTINRSRTILYNKLISHNRPHIITNEDYIYIKFIGRSLIAKFATRVPVDILCSFIVINIKTGETKIGQLYEQIGEIYY